MRYAELQVTTHFSFLRGASSAEELFATAKLMGIEALGIVDRNSLAGIVRALEASRATGLRLVVGCRLVWLTACRSRLPDRSCRLFAADAAADFGQEQRRESQLHPTC